ncbi:phosphatase PAP2 family protein [Humibacillus sp. DSM 29435]|uniref:phosphatase PAP2 family protein n=1 Tax=Humibacillus sp. DSM 29435 TaxID=1869167 RepID=UPI000A710808|nr:phosphatase PAP2 family protein [Humibacillus sp. DSM 29435]
MAERRASDGGAQELPSQHPSTGEQRIGRGGRVGRLLKAVGFGLAFAVPVTVLAFVVRERVSQVIELDERLVSAATDITRDNPWLRTFLIGWQEATQPKWLYIAATAVCVVVWKRRGSPTRAAWAFVTMMVAWNLQLVLKEVVRRARPIVADPIEHAPGFSFPSGHVANAAAIATAMVLLLWPFLGRRGRAAKVGGGVVFVVVTCLDRVFLGVHYPSDTAAGVLFGVGLVTASYLGYRGWNPVAPDDPPPTEPAPPRTSAYPQGTPKGPP